MKAILKTVVALVVVALTGSVVKAQTTTTPATVPMMSVGTLKAYALANVSSLSGQYYGDSVSSGSWLRIPYPHKDADPDHMASLLSEQVIEWSADPSELLGSYVSYGSTSIVPNSWFEMFSGSANFFLTKVGEEWHVPAAGNQVRLQLGNWIPLRIQGVQDAYIVTQNADGYDTDYYNFRWDNRIDTERGYIILGRQLVNQRGKLYVSLNDGSKLVYDLRKEGDLIPAVAPEAGGLTPSIDGVRTVPENTTTIVFQDGDELVRAKYSLPIEQKVFVAFPPGLSRYPVAVYVVDADAFTANPFMDWAQFVVWKDIIVGAKRGSLLFRFEYDEPAPSLPEYQNNGGGGGKG